MDGGGSGNHASRRERRIAERRSQIVARLCVAIERPGDALPGVVGLHDIDRRADQGRGQVSEVQAGAEGRTAERRLKTRSYRAIAVERLGDRVPAGPGGGDLVIRARVVVARVDAGGAVLRPHRGGVALRVDADTDTGDG